MSLKPFLKWAGGKRWLLDHPDFQLPFYGGRYIEPFLGGGAMFFAQRPSRALLSDANTSLIETYEVVKKDWRPLVRLLGRHHNNHCKEYYYEQRARRPETPTGRAAQFIYLNRTCWNGLYRVNQLGQFNVPIGTKGWILSGSDNFYSISQVLQNAELVACDFEVSISQAGKGDLIFADPPYTVAHNFNGFVKYNQILFSWTDQIRLASALRCAVSRGATVVATNADHSSVSKLYYDFEIVRPVSRASVISGDRKGRQSTTELLIISGLR